MRKGYQYRIYPNKMQFVLLLKTFGCVRFVYNFFLAFKITAYEEQKKALSCSALIKMLPALKREYAFLKEIDSIALQQALKHMDAAFKNFFEGRSGYPNFKSKHKSKRSYTTCNVNNNIRIESGCIILPKIGAVRLKQHRPLPENSTIKSATISMTPSGECYVSVLCECENQAAAKKTESILGLDYSSPYLYVDSEGREPDYEKPFLKYQEKLAREQRKLSKMREANIKGYDSLQRPIWKKPLSECKNYQKQKAKVAKIHAKIANCRKDALHKISHDLAENYDVIAVEDLSLKGMSQSSNLGKATMDNGYGMLVRMLEYKLADRGKMLVKVSRWFASTKTCSCCGNKKPVARNERTYICPVCGAAIDRDLNAAINIREEAKRILSA